jgi:hypothetical protein
MEASLWVSEENRGSKESSCYIYLVERLDLVERLRGQGLPHAFTEAQNRVHDEAIGGRPAISCAVA